MDFSSATHCYQFLIIYIEREKASSIQHDHKKCKTYVNTKFLSGFANETLVKCHTLIRYRLDKAYLSGKLSNAYVGDNVAMLLKDSLEQLAVIPGVASERTDEVSQRLFGDVRPVRVDHFDESTWRAAITKYWDLGSLLAVRWKNRGNVDLKYASPVYVLPLRGYRGSKNTHIHQIHIYRINTVELVKNETYRRFNKISLIALQFFIAFQECKKQVPFSIAMENVELMDVCFPNTCALNNKNEIWQRNSGRR